VAAVVFIAWALLGICFLTGTWLPAHTPHLAQDSQTQPATWRLLSLLQPSGPRRLLEVRLVPSPPVLSSRTVPPVLLISASRHLLQVPSGRILLSHLRTCKDRIDQDQNGGWKY